MGRFVNALTVLATLTGVLLAQTEEPGAPGPPLSLGELRSAIVEHRSSPFPIVARVTRVMGLTQAGPAARPGKDYEVLLTSMLAAVGPGVFYTEGWFDVQVRAADGVTPAPPPNAGQAIKYWHAADGRIYLMRPVAALELKDPAYGVQMWAEVLPEPDDGYTLGAEQALQVPVGAPGALARSYADVLGSAEARVSQETVEGLGCVRVDAVWADRKSHRTLWFAPERDYVCMRDESVYVRGEFVAVAIRTATECRQVEGAWFPSLAEHVCYRRPSGGGEWWILSVDTVVSRDVEPLPDRGQLFLPIFPNATAVYRPEAGGKRDVVGVASENLLQAMASGDTILACPPAPELLGDRTYAYE